MIRTPVISAAASTTGQILANCWGGECTISAEAPKAPLDTPPNSRAAVGASADGGSGAKLDTPDSQGGKMDPGPRGNKIDGEGGKAPLPKFTLSAYNGGPMTLAGFKFPVVIDASGVQFATPLMPIYVGHPADNAPASELMETLVGQAMCACNDGKITACGEVTGTSATVQQMLTHSRNGFKFQNSVHGRPTKMDFVKPGETVQVNGQTLSGPVIVARASLLDHIAILPLGADTSTVARIAATHAAGAASMEKFAWISANYGLDEAAFNALPETARNTISAAYDAANKEPEAGAGQKISAAGSVADTEALIKAQNAAIASNLKRVADINAIDGASEFPAIAAQAVSEGWSAEKAENAIIKAQRDKLTKQSSTGGNRFGGATNTPEFSAAFPRVLEASILLSCGYKGDLAQDRRYGEKVANMTDDFYRSQRTRVLSPSTVARIIARNAGVSLPDGHGDDFWSEALAHEAICPRGGQRLISAEFSSISLPVALSNVMNKFMLDAYTSVDPNYADPNGTTQAWKQFTRVSSVQDFKPHYRMRMVASLLLKRLNKGGEIEHGTVGEQSYMLAADTKAIMLGLTRKDLINDDQSVLSSLPTHFGIGAAETVANDVYACLLTGLQSDNSTAFFNASDITTEGAKMKANLTSGAALAFATLEAARTRFSNQTKPNGQPAGLRPEILLTPPALVGTAQNLYKSSEIRDTTSSTKYGTTNILAGMYKPVASAYMANGAINSLTGATVAGSATTWMLLTSAMAQAYAIEIGFLNGVEVPIIERAEADFNRLGISFRTFLDYGVAMSEPRSAQKQTA